MRLLIPALLILAGAGLIFYALWELRRVTRLLRSGPDLGAEARRLENLAADIAAAAGEVAEDLERRSERLTALLQAADERLAALRGALAVQVPPPPPPAAAPAPPGPAPAAAVPPPPAAPALPELHRRVYELADAGLDAEAVARELKLARGEVQLVLGLRRLS